MTKKKDCSHFTNIDKEQLDKMLKKILTFKYVPNSQSTVVFKEDFSQLRFHELLRNQVLTTKVLKQNQFLEVAKQRQISQIKMGATYSYSEDTSDAYRESILLNLKKKNKQLKIKRFRLTLHKL